MVFYYAAAAITYANFSNTVIGGSCPMGEVKRLVVQSQDLKVNALLRAKKLYRFLCQSFPWNMNKMNSFV